MLEDVEGERLLVGGAGDGDEVREAQQRDQHQHGLRRLPVLLGDRSNSVLGEFIAAWLVIGYCGLHQ